jgi:hypothetical protein
VKPGGNKGRAPNRAWSGATPHDRGWRGDLPGDLDGQRRFTFSDRYYSNVWLSNAEALASALLIAKVCGQRLDLSDFITSPGAYFPSVLELEEDGAPLDVGRMQGHRDVFKARSRATNGNRLRSRRL